MSIAVLAAMALYVLPEYKCDGWVTTPPWCGFPDDGAPLLWRREEVGFDEVCVNY